MARLSDFGLTSKPSARTVRTTAVPDVKTPTRYDKTAGSAIPPADDGLLADPIAYKTATKEEAEALVRKQYPDLFKTDQQIREEATARAAGLKLTGSKRSKYLTTEINNARRNIRYSRDAEVDATLKRLQGQYDKEYEAEKVRLDPIRRDQDRFNRTENLQREQAEYLKRANEEMSEQGYVSSETASYFSRNTRQNLNMAEASLQAKYLNDPEGQQHFQQVQDYLQQLSEATPEERGQILSQLQEEANALVDEPFNRKKQIVGDRLSTRIRQLNEQYQTLSEAEEYKLQQAVMDADEDTIDALDKGIEDLFARGGLNSGLLRRLADELIEKREIGVKDANKVKELNLKSAEQKKEHLLEGDRYEANVDLFDIEQERKAERSIQLSDMINDFTQQGLLADLMGGAAEYQQNTGQGLASTTRNSAGVPISNIQRVRSTILPTVKATAGSSLDLARQAAAGGLTLEQQRVARDKLLNTAPTASSVRSTPLPPSSTTNRSISPTTPTQRVTNVNTGKTYSGAAAQRLAIRQSRL